MKSCLIMASGTSYKRRVHSKCRDPEHFYLNTDWKDVTCPICLDFPHNGVLLRCTSYDKGCQPFMCDTDHTHSNCLDRFRSAYGMPSAAKVPLSADVTSEESNELMAINTSAQPLCPLCRGVVTGWVVIDDARIHLNMKKRFCEEEQCTYVGNYSELQNHMKLKHPHARPSKIDPARQLDWDNFQQSSEIIDVLSTIHSEVPRGVILGDYVIEYGEDDIGDVREDSPRRRWWTSCILYQIFDNFRALRNRQRSRTSETRRGHRRSSYDPSISDDGFVTSVDVQEFSMDEIDYVARRFTTRGDSSQRSSWRHRSHFPDC